MARRLLRLNECFDPESKIYKRVVELRRNGAKINFIHDKTRVPNDIIKSICNMIFPSGETRQCNICKKIKNLNEFEKRGNQTLRHCKDCKPSTIENNRIRKISKKQVKTKDPMRERNVYLKNRYDITIKDYETMLSKQSNSCAICGISQSECDYLFHVDHDHKTGKVRGLLCRQCNYGLGCFKDTISNFINAIKYLGGIYA